MLFATIYIEDFFYWKITRFYHSHQTKFWM